VRIAFSFAGGRGHLEPLLPLALAAAAAGHDVAVAGGHNGVRAAADLGLRTFPLGPPPSEKPRERLPLLEVDLERERRDVRERFVRRHARATVPRALELYERWKPDVLVYDEMDYGGMVAAELLALPYATVLVNASGSMVTPAVVAEPLDELRAEHGLPPDPTARMLTRHLVLSPFPPSLRDPDFPLPDGAVSFRAITATPPAAPPWPVARPGAPTVYFTLGTEFNVESGDLFARVLAGLRELPVNVVATVGSDIDPEELGAQPEHVHVARFIPQALVLPHCDAIVSHGGSGSVLGALAHGLPQVLIPMGADQPLNAARCEELGLALTLDPVRATPEQVRDAVATVLAEPSYRDAAARLRAEIEALPPPEHAVPPLAELVARFTG
jgi:UDP:flavonoid glycosyltransferase YjiC (YdhE family)